MKRKSARSRNFMLSICVFFGMYQTGDTEGAACSRPGRTSNVLYEPARDSYKAGDGVQYKCRQKGLLSGSHTIYCQENGLWSDRIPVCYQAVLLQRVQQSTEVLGKSAYLTVDGNTSTCGQTQNEDRHAFWEGHLSAAYYIFAISVTVPNSAGEELEVFIKGDNTPEVQCKKYLKRLALFTDTFTFNCSENTFGKYIQVRNRHSVLRICELNVFLKPGIFCDPPATVVNGNVTYVLVDGTVPYNGTATYRCSEGYSLIGSSTIRCLQQREWNNPFPVCQQNVYETTKVLGCSRLPSVINGELIYNSTRFGSTAQLKCFNGHKPVSDNTVSCLESGFWSSNRLLCSAIQCEYNPYVPHGRAILLNNSTYYGAHLQIFCNKNSSHEPLIRSCESNSSWGDLDVCAEIVCGAFKQEREDKGDWIQLNGTKSIHILVCPDGFHIEGGPPFVRCSANGSWSYTSAICKSPAIAEAWGASWKPSIIFIAAVAIGAASAIFILCSAIIFITIRKRRQAKSTAAVFHLGVNDDTVTYKDSKKESVSTELSRYSNYSYDDAIELRPKSSGTNLRKPHSALPVLPLDTDPVYAQPFESPSKSALLGTTNKEDLYTVHIYAEPIDTRRQVISMKQPLRYSKEVHDCKTSLTSPIRKRSLTSQQSLEKKCAIYDSSGASNFDGKTRTPPEHFFMPDETIMLQSLTKNSEYVSSVDLM